MARATLARATGPVVCVPKEEEKETTLTPKREFRTVSSAYTLYRKSMVRKWGNAGEEEIKS
jgi:hypothetical protein